MLIKRVWIERIPGADVDPKNGFADVLVEVEGDELWQAQFVTLSHLRQEMQLSLDVARAYDKTLWTTQFIALETPHVIVDQITQETIENVVDNLMALGVFESIFKELSHYENKVKDASTVQIEGVVHGTT
ncbi:MAG: hypothetical protein K8S97_10950 [Anaerolineae bacterium]|nr:hypothetical protein [Anaerolineae bacterium]